MKNIFKAIVITAIAAATVSLNGCKAVNELRANDDFNTEVSESTSASSESSSASTPAEEPTSSKVNSVVTSDTAVSDDKTVSTSVETSKAETSSTGEPTSKIEENIPSASSAATSSKPVVKPVETHTHNFSKATCEKPATCSCGATNGNPLGHNFTTATCAAPSTCMTCGITKGTTTNHTFVNGICVICRKNDPNYVAVAPHNCKTDGHTWGNSYTEVETKTVEVIEYHDVTGSGYDCTLAMRYFGKTESPTDYGIVGTCTSSQNMKTTNTVKTTKYLHKCTECGYTEMYNSTEEVIPSNVWERCVTGCDLSDTIWWDINNIPADVRAASDREKELIDEWLQTW